MTDTELLSVNEALAQREARIAKLEAALKEYADRRNWRVSDSSSGFLDRWIGDDGPQIAQLALHPAAARPDCGHPFRVGDVCPTCVAADAESERDDATN